VSGNDGRGMSSWLCALLKDGNDMALGSGMCNASGFASGKIYLVFKDWIRNFYAEVLKTTQWINCIV